MGVVFVTPCTYLLTICLLVKRILITRSIDFVIGLNEFFMSDMHIHVL